MTGERWTGSYYDGVTAQRRAVALFAEPAGLRVTFDDGASLVWPYDALRQTQGRFPGEQLRLEVGADPVQSVLVNEPGLVEAVQRVAPDAGRSLKGKRATARVVAGALTILAVMIAGYFWGAPAMAAWLAPRVPVAWEVAMGQTVAGSVAQSGRVCGDSASLAILRGILDRLVATDSANPYVYRLAVVRDTQVNAFAAPGGFVMLHSGLVAAARSPEELAGVLAHEVEHVALRHSTRALIREMPLRYALASVTGNDGAGVMASVAGSLGALRYRRADETEADREGMRRLVAAGVDPAGLVTFMQRLDADRGDLPRFVSYLSTHPASAARVAQLEAVVADGGSWRPIVDSVAWSGVRRICR